MVRKPIKVKSHVPEENIEAAGREILTGIATVQVLVIEDKALVGLNLVDTFEDAGYAVASAVSTSTETLT